METFFIGIFILVALIILGGMLFTAWVAFMIIRAIVRTVNGRPQPAMRPPAVAPLPPNTPPLKYFPLRQPPAVQWARCPRERCRTPNPPEAQFCRRCGMNLVAAKVSASPTNGRVLARA